MAYQIFHSETFDKEIAKFDESFRKRVDKIEDQLLENPYVGDPLSVKWFREKRIQERRIYYIIYEDLKTVFMVAVSGKKDQQEVIDGIRLLFDEFRRQIEDILGGEIT